MLCLIPRTKTTDQSYIKPASFCTNHPDAAVPPKMYDILRVSITLCAIQLVLSIVRKYQIEESTKKYSKFIKVEVGGED